MRQKAKLVPVRAMRPAATDVRTSRTARTHQYATDSIGHNAPLAAPQDACLTVEGLRRAAHQRHVVDVFGARRVRQRVVGIARAARGRRGRCGPRSRRGAAAWRRGQGRVWRSASPGASRMKGYVRRSSMRERDGTKGTKGAKWPGISPSWRL